MDWHICSDMCRNPGIAMHHGPPCNEELCQAANQGQTNEIIRSQISYTGNLTGDYGPMRSSQDYHCTDKVFARADCTVSQNTEIFAA